MKNLAPKLAALGLTGAALTAAVFIAPFENDGDDPSRLAVHLDPIGIPTACYGRVRQGLVLGQQFTEDQCAQQFAEDLTQHNNQMLRAVRVQLSEQEQIAYLSFHYNVGPGAFRDSTLLRKLNEGLRVDACIELTHACSRSRGTCEGWTFAGGRQLPGLLTRRREERDLCLKGALSHVQN